MIQKSPFYTPGQWAQRAREASRQGERVFQTHSPWKLWQTEQKVGFSLETMEQKIILQKYMRVKMRKPLTEIKELKNLGEI